MLMATNGPLRRLPYSCSARATSSLPVPDLARDHHREVGLGEPRQHAVDFLHGRAAADQRQPSLGSAASRGVLRRGSASARPTTEMSSFRSKGFGRYS